MVDLRVGGTEVPDPVSYENNWSDCSKQGSQTFFYITMLFSGILAFIILAPISHCVKHGLETLTEFSQ